jgi:hypothetical protein
MSDICGVYENDRLLKNTRTRADLDAIKTYCTNAMNFRYGPNPDTERVPQQTCNCPFGYGYNYNAYNFQSGPSFINLNQSLNYQKQQQLKDAFRGVPGGNGNRGM